MRPLSQYLTLDSTSLETFVTVHMQFTSSGVAMRSGVIGGADVER